MILTAELNQILKCIINDNDISASTKINLVKGVINLFDSQED